MNTQVANINEEKLTGKKFIELEDKYGAHNYHPLDVVIERAEGVWVYDTDGKRYLDCLAAYSAVNQGHCHPRIVQALIEQAHKVTLTSRAFRNDQLPLLYKELCELTGFDKALPMNSGAEAVETAIKAARKWGYKIKGIPEGTFQIWGALVDITAGDKLQVNIEEKTLFLDREQVKTLVRALTYWLAIKP